jgi:TetR/AcrR family transcriptional regulator of autoinduction and epiphytic fitness
VSETVVTDGRVSRSARTRAAVVDALLALINSGNLRPTAREVADEAGVSLRSVYVHFDDVESLFVAAAARYFEGLQGLHIPCDPTAGLDERIATLVESRLRIYSAGHQVRRAAMLQEPFSPALARARDFGRRSGRAEIDTVFAPELGARAPDQGTRLRAALEVALSANTWETLTSNPDVPSEDVAALMADLVRAALYASWDTRGAPETPETPATPDTQRPPPTSTGPA